jgi:hypothetical protein
METKVNVRGKLNALEVNQTLTLPKGPCKPSTVRYTAAVLKGDTGKTFTVNATADKTITVTRLS